MILAAIAGLAGQQRTPAEMMPRWDPEPDKSPEDLFAEMEEAFRE
jgi:hypothetical protein